jgi:Na+-transporting NADH:ubiquinone oxidoreductase subunit NqrC
MEVSHMPKAQGRKKSSAVRNSSRVATASGKNTANTALARETSVDRQTPIRQTRSTNTGVAGMIMPGMVALGCWGMAFTFTVFSTDPNRLLFGGMAALMALMWSVSFGMRVRKVLRQK